MASYGKGSFDGFTPYQGDSRDTGDRGSDFSKLSSNISSNIQKITQNVAQIQRFANQIGTPQDSNDVRQRAHQTTHYTHQLAKETSTYLKNLSHLPTPASQSEQRQWKMQRERLTEEFSNALKNLQTVQRSTAERERASVQRARAHSGLDKDDYYLAGLPTVSFKNQSPFDDEPYQDEPMSGAGFSQTREVLQMEQDVDLELIKEREGAIRQLESDIMDVNQIFKDLGMLVHEQGEVLDSIEANIDNAQMSVEEGTKQLSKARQYQSKARRKKCCLLMIILVVLIIIGVVIYIATR